MFKFRWAKDLCFCKMSHLSNPTTGLVRKNFNVIFNTIIIPFDSVV